MERAEFLIKQALYEDERNRPNDALPLYTDAAELCIKTVSSLKYYLLEFYTSLYSTYLNNKFTVNRLSLFSLQSNGLPDDDNLKKKLHSLAKQAIER